MHGGDEDGGGVNNVSKTDRVRILKEEITGHLMRLQLHGGVIPQWNHVVALATTAVNGAGITASMVGKTSDELTDIIASVGTSCTATKYNGLSELLFMPHKQVVMEVETQAKAVRKMILTIAELLVTNEFSEPNGLVSWIKFSKTVSGLLTDAARAM